MELSVAGGSRVCKPKRLCNEVFEAMPESSEIASKTPIEGELLFFLPPTCRFLFVS